MEYTHDKKKKLAERISKLKKKEDKIAVAQIIYQHNKDMMENENGLFMFFHKYDDITYHKIEQYLKSLNKKKSSDDANTLSDKSDTKEYVSYSKSDFPDQDGLNSKLKYSNKEKNIIKRQRYDDLINDGNDDSIYQKFSVNIDSDDSVKSQPKPIKQPIKKPQKTNKKT